MPKRKFLCLLSSVLCLLCAFPLFGQDEQPTFMKLLSDRGQHDIDNESWNAYGQFTYISSWKPSFHAPYTNLNGSPQLTTAHPGAEFYRHSDPLPRRTAVERCRRILCSRTHLAARLFRVEGFGRGHSEFRTAKERIGDTSGLLRARLPPTDVRSWRRTRSGPVRSDATGKRLRQPARRFVGREVHHSRFL
jgi:hypothetical protein